MRLFNSDFLEYIELLNKHHVEYVLVGGMAVNIHGYRRTTGDMDIFVNPSPRNHLKLKNVHLDFGMHMGKMEELDNFLNTSKFDVFTFGASPIQIDILTVCKGISFDKAQESSVHYELDDGLSVSVVDYQTLISAKKSI
ncbi:MAG: hypothetical protein DRI71_04190 [Bacteroidetes bacterium]|nr:MAG: hypothetical protein DRI71_04190 [Bacteroidota bacterium]